MELKNLKTQDLQGLIQEQLKLYIIENGMKSGEQQFEKPLKGWKL
jgi:hypothetical protein